MSEQSRSYRQIRSTVLAEVAHLEWEQAVPVLVSAVNERAMDRTAAWIASTTREGRQNEAHRTRL